MNAKRPATVERKMRVSPVTRRMKSEEVNDEYHKGSSRWMIEWKPGRSPVEWQNKKKWTVQYENCWFCWIDIWMSLMRPPWNSIVTSLQRIAQELIISPMGKGFDTHCIHDNQYIRLICVCMHTRYFCLYNKMNEREKELANPALAGPATCICLKDRCFQTTLPELSWNRNRTRINKFILSLFQFSFPGSWL